MPHQGAADAVYGTVDDSDAWGVASGFDPSGGEPMYQAGGIWVSIPASLLPRAEAAIFREWLASCPRALLVRE